MITHHPRRCTVYGGRGEPEDLVLDLDPFEPELPPEAYDPSRVRVRSIMSRDLVCARPDLEIAALVRLVLRHRIGCVPVVDVDRRPIGLVAEIDLVEQLEATLRAMEAGHPLPPDLRTTAQDVMIPQAVLLDETASIATAAEAVTCDPSGHVLLTGSDGILVGVLSSRDIVRWLDENNLLEPRRRRYPSGTNNPPWRPLEG